MADANIVIATAVVVDRVENRNCTTEEANDAIPIAPVLLNYDDASPDVQARDVAQKSTLGSDKGRIAAIEERKRIFNENRKVSSGTGQVANEAHRIKAATQIGRQRDKVVNSADATIVQVETTGRKIGVKVDCEANAKPKDLLDEPGYKIGQYNINSFKGGEYDSSYEYKSVYE